MGVSASAIKSLREKTGAGIMNCKAALQASEGDLEKSIEFLRKKGLATATKKSSRATNEGSIGSYIHYGGKIGVLVEVNCETDFVAMNPEFQALVKDLSMQVAGANPVPLYVCKEEVPEDLIAHERAIYKTQAMESKKPEAVIEKIADGKIKKYLQQICLMEQPYLKDPDLTISELVAQTISKVGENIKIRRFVRFQLGEGEA